MVAPADDLIRVINRTQPATMNKMWLPVASAFAGIIAFLPFNFYPAAFIFLVPLFIFFLREEKLWRLLVGAAIFRLIIGAGTVYFSLEPFFWLSSLLIFLGLPISVWMIKKIISRLGGPTPKWGLDLQVLVFLPFAWTFFDLMEAHFSLMPTYIFSTGNALGSSPFLGLATVGGMLMLTFFVALINILVATLIIRRSNHRVVISLTAAIILVLLSSCGLSRFELQKNAVAYENLPNSFTVATVATDETFTPDSFPRLLQELKGKNSDLVVFPENMLNGLIPTDFEFQNAARELNATVIAAYDTFQQNGGKYNSATLFDTQGNSVGVHNKNRLTFVGEYWPFGDWQPSLYQWLREKNPRIGTYAIFDPENADRPGERNLLSATLGGNIVQFAAPICLEIHYMADIKEYQDAGARFIVNQSSNRWISVGLEHFLYLTGNLKKIEAVWLGLPIISSGVRDIAGVTTPDGQPHTAPVSNKNYSVFFGSVRY